MELNLRRYLDWYATRDVKDKSKGPPVSTQKLLTSLEQLIISKEGRLKIALAMVQASQKRLEKIRGGISSQREVRRFIIELEKFIGILPDEESFSPVIMAMRKHLFELCDILTGRYGVKASQEEYEGPRPTRFERLLGTDDEGPSLDDLESDEPLIQAIV
jgi:hypothetical protein